ncbi:MULTISPECIES: rhomboid family intramembrane serine protease [Heyndrickxia]|jgi:membrane associated rhomboid family serine protease|uniref:rhomboid family intramembrane serine protease n=1 Tax=Heyndrickxia TaxID=2837504 RepID=UPI00039C2AB8|nr:rhomboid family intramembrane serine protease [Heyndrickxia oleronia]NYV65913.1 rhomboid family intramembrane serine protease [Bacillus sp. Gen3]OJH16567.1 rhomboid family intramembrane serine protease [Bacillus obstructivus]MBU5214651.1 rhomboid family intramembrane serine protease [Heyndrickxia oleronia]MCI1589263.1 rhomboid family intramembrane serine protease [Heyndrickxia oleronia]MCI1612446.1 rhomboid family intramembrane serine protease [Heyndrickxia oleronia]
MFTRHESFSQYVRNYPVISTIILLQILLFIINFIPMIPHKFILQYLSGVNIYIANGEYWRLITPIFVHRDFTHLFFNSFSLLIFGPFLETTLEKKLFSLFYLGCGLMANIATYLFLPLTYGHVGASGAIFGLFGIYLALIVLKKIEVAKSTQIIIPLIAIAFIMTFLESNVNIIAHIFGLSSGFLFSLVYFLLKKK